MEQVKDLEVYKHVCKLCNKRYPSGKSLGGHMRSHVIANAKKHKHISTNANKFATSNDEEDDTTEGEESEDENKNNGGDQTDKEKFGYKFRENPKKTWRLVDNNNSGKQEQLFEEQERVCKQCGKGFHSLKALCGHMSCHSEKERNCKEEEDISWSSDSKEQFISGVVQYDDNNIKRRTRSSLLRYKSLTTVASLSPTGGCGGGSLSDQSEMDQHEQEEVAMCLMMLSRDFFGHKTCFEFVTESSDNSMILGTGIRGRRKDLNMTNDLNKIEQVIVMAKNNEGNVMNDTKEINNSESGYFENAAQDLESDDSVVGFVRNYGYKNAYNKDDDSTKRKVGDFNFDSPESDENRSKKIMMNDYCYGYNNSNMKKRGKYECWICNRTFKTHQALGGHIISHRKTGSSISAKQLSDSESTKMMASSKAKKVKGYKCPYCPRVFKSGQALGGHKRSHMMGGGSSAVVNLHLEAEKSRIEQRAPPEPEPDSKQPTLIDLNLPAFIEEEGNANSHIVAW